MTKAYVVMAGGDSPIAIIIPSPVAVFRSLAAANKYAKDKNKKSQRKFYYVRSAENHLGDPFKL